MSKAINSRPNTAMYFTSVIAFRKNMAVIGGHMLAHGPSPTATRFMICLGEKWGHLTDLSDVAYAAVRKPDNPKAIAIMGRNGLYREIIGNNPPIDFQLPEIRNLYLMDLRAIGGNLFACGVQNQVFRQTGGIWVKVDQGTFSPFVGDVDRRLESIHGFSTNDIYAVGSSGAIWHYDGQTWSRLDSPTNVTLNVVLCASDGFVYVGGATGLLLRGRRDAGWQQIGSPEEILGVVEDLAEFQGKIYVTCTSKLFRIADDIVEDVEIPVEGERCFYAVDATPESLWCVGGEVVLQFDGTKWEQFLCPENQPPV